MGDNSGEGFKAWWEDRSLPEKIVVGIGFGILGIGFVVLYIWAFMALWNWLMPEIFGLKTIDYWQSMGLLALACMLFNRWGESSNSPARSDRKRRRQLKRYLSENPDQPGTP